MTEGAALRERIAPCGLDCGRCLDNPDSPIGRLSRELAGNEAVPERLMHIPAYRNAGYDYAPILAAPGLFPHPRPAQEASCSMNHFALPYSLNFDGLK